MQRLSDLKYYYCKCCSSVLLMMMTSILHAFTTYDSHHATHKVNTFIAAAHTYARIKGEQSCWVCGLLPTSADTYPYLAVPLTLIDYMTVFNQTKNPMYKAEVIFIHHPITQGTLEPMKIRYAPRGLMCWVNNRDGMNMGESKCDYYVISTQPLLMALPGNWGWPPRILPASVVVPKVNLTQSEYSTGIHRYKRSTTETKSPPLFSNVKGFFMTLFPMYGVAYLGHRMNDVFWSLENLTASVLHLAEFVKDDPEKRAMKTMIMQNRMASDFLLAEKGEVCALVGDYCCTIIPDSTDNITQIIDDSHWAWDKNLLSWLTSSSWWSILLKLLMPVMIVFILLCLISTCVIPCIRSMIAKMVSTRLMYVHALYQQTYSLIPTAPLIDENTSAV
uniref:Uncharacterized protein n=1 Tax=Cynoglossus semilaevis TaxID=244447 RepID=A0A3P8W288_CYNSE